MKLFYFAVLLKVLPTGSTALGAYHERLRARPAYRRATAD